MSTFTTISNTVRVGQSQRADFPIVPERAALLIIDVQDFLSSPATASEEDSYLFTHALPKAIPNIVQLTKTMRKLRDGEGSTVCDGRSGCEVIFTYLEALTDDCRDMSLDYKLSGPKFQQLPGPSRRAGFFTLPYDLTPIEGNNSSKGDILLPKTSCSVFQSTNLNYILRNLNIEQLIICGQLTDQCVLSAVRDGADLGYFMTVVEDACAACSTDEHMRGLDGMRGFSRIVTTKDVLKELSMSSATSATINSISSPITISKTLKSEDNAPKSDSAEDHQEDFIPLQTIHPSESKSASSSMEAVLSTLTYSGIKFLRFASLDIANSIRAKQVPLKRIMTSFQQVQEEDHHSSDAMSANILNHQVSIAKCCIAALPSYADVIVSSNLSARDVLVIHPDLHTLRVLPYAKGTAMVMGNLHDQITGKLSEFCTRGLLQRVIETAKVEGLGFAVGCEIEFCLYRDSGNGTSTDSDLIPVDQSLFAHPSGLNEQNDFLNDLNLYLEQQRIDIELVHAESASGQFEVVLKYQRDVMRLADAVLMARETIRECARMHGLKALFTPKLRSDEAGNGMHLHISLRDVSKSSSNPSKNIFPLSAGTGISNVGSSFIEGILCALPALMSITLPSNNSFSRVGKGCWTGHNCSWAYEDKESPLRVCIDLLSREATNVEFKLMDSSANIYLALASILYAGFIGVKKAMKLRPPSTSANASDTASSESLPSSFEQSLDILQTNELLNTLMGGPLMQCYTAVKRAEIEHERNQK